MPVIPATLGPTMDRSQVQGQHWDNVETASQKEQNKTKQTSSKLGIEEKLPQSDCLPRSYLIINY